mgnify:CR=1
MDALTITKYLWGERSLIPDYNKSSRPFQRPAISMWSYANAFCHWVDKGVSIRGSTY